MRSTVIATDAAFFSKDPFDHQLRPGQRDCRLPADRRSTARFDATQLAIGAATSATSARRRRPEARRAAARPIPLACGGTPADCRVPAASSTACRRSRSSTGPAPALAPPAAPQRRGRRYDLADAGALRRPGDGHAPRPVRQRAAGSASGSARPVDRGDVRVTDDRPAPRASSSATPARSPSPASTSTVARGRDLRPGRARTAPARRRRCGSSRRSCAPTAGHAEVAGMSVRRNPDAARRVLGFMPDVFGVYDDMKVWEYLDFFARCYGIRRPPAADDRRPARARRPRRQARRLRPEPLARHAAAAVPRPHARPRSRRSCSSTSRRPASTRGPGSSCASCSASCARWARRS